MDFETPLRYVGNFKFTDFHPTIHTCVTIQRFQDANEIWRFQSVEHLKYSMIIGELTQLVDRENGKTQ